MLKIFNLLVSSARGNEREANAELRYLLNELGDNTVATGYTSVSGLTVANTSLDPLDAVQRLRPVLAKRPWQFRYILKIKPIVKVVPAETGSVADAVSDLSSSIGPNESFRISVQKRHSNIQTRELIDMAAKRVPRKVDLQNPSRIVLVEVLGEVAGVSVVSPSDVLAIEPEKKGRVNRSKPERNALLQAA